MGLIPMFLNNFTDRILKKYDIIENIKKYMNKDEVI